MKFLDSGRKQFPQEPGFHLMRGQLEMRRGPTRCNRRLARECFEMAIETARTSGHRKAKDIQQLAGERLRLLDDVEETPRSTVRGRPAILPAFRRSSSMLVFRGSTSSKRSNG